MALLFSSLHSRFSDAVAVVVAVVLVLVCVADEVKVKICAKQLAGPFLWVPETQKQTMRCPTGCMLPLC